MTRTLRRAAPSLSLATLLVASLLGLSACSTTAPEGIAAVTPFDIERYQGKWYEICLLYTSDAADE